MSELQVLQAVRLKGRVSPEDLAATVVEEPATVARTVEALTESGLLTEGHALRVTPDGRTRLAELLAVERAGVDSNAIAATYGGFRPVNAAFKALVSDWQLREGELNPHDDPDYDAAVLARLDAVHEQVVHIIGAAAEQIPRLVAYADKLDGALANIKGGDVAWLTRPLIDSYHTVWFELHEELILAAGLTREAEAKAGHAH